MRLILLLCACLFSVSVVAEPITYAKKITINSRAFDSERTIRISLPTSYDSNTSSRYPVIYVVRGQLDLLAVVASLNMLDDEVPEFITVGVDGIIGEFFPSTKGKQTDFSRFLHDEVRPYIEQTYRTAPYSVLAAHSAASIFSINDWLEDGVSFSKYIMISPPLEGGQFVKQVKSKNSELLKGKNSALITVGDEGEVTKGMFNTLVNVFSETSNVTFKYFPEQTHMSGRVNAMMHGLRQDFPEWEPSRALQNGELGGLQKHYDMLSTRYGFTIDIPLDMLARMSAAGSRVDDVTKNDNAVAVVKYVLARNRGDVDALFDIAEQLASIGEADAGKRLVTYICDEGVKNERCEES